MSLDPNGAPAGYGYQVGATAYLIDPAGIYSQVGASAPTTDPAGAYSAAGASAPTTDQAGTVRASGVAAGLSPSGAPAGYYYQPAATACVEDPAGAYGLAGASAPTIDPTGVYTDPAAIARKPAAAEPHIAVAQATSGATGVYPAGADSLAGPSARIADRTGAHSGRDVTASAPTADQPDTIGALAASAGLDPNGAPPGYYYQIGATAYVEDPAGTYSAAGASAPTTDPAGTYSGAGASAPMLAAAGTYIPVSGATSSAAEITSPPGTYAPPGASAPIADPEGTYSAAGASAPTSDHAGTYSSPYALDRLFLVGLNNTPANTVLSFSSVTAVENYYGVTSREASLATEYFAGYADTSATMLFTRYGRNRRPHLLGANISDLTIPELQSIDGSIAISLKGYAYSASLNLASVTSFADAAKAIQAALNTHLQVAAVTAGSSIAPVSVSFTGSLKAAFLQVTSVSSGSMEIGAFISGSGIESGSQIIAQLSGTPGGVGTYTLYQGTGTIHRKR
jgi:hypothetical protein